MVFSMIKMALNLRVGGTFKTLKNYLGETYSNMIMPW